MSRECVPINTNKFGCKIKICFNFHHHLITPSFNCPLRVVWMLKSYRMNTCVAKCYRGYHFILHFMNSTQF